MSDIVRYNCKFQMIYSLTQLWLQFAQGIIELCMYSILIHLVKKEHAICSKKKLLYHCKKFYAPNAIRKVG